MATPPFVTYDAALDTTGATIIGPNLRSAGVITASAASVTFPSGAVAASAAVNDEALVRTAAAATIGKKYLSSGMGVTSTGFVSSGAFTPNPPTGVSWCYIRVGRMVKFSFSVTATAVPNGAVLTITLASLEPLAGSGTFPPGVGDIVNVGGGAVVNSSSNVADAGYSAVVTATATTLIITFTLATTGSTAARDVLGEVWYLTAA